MQGIERFSLQDEDFTIMKIIIVLIVIIINIIIVVSIVLVIIKSQKSIIPF